MRTKAIFEIIDKEKSAHKAVLILTGSLLKPQGHGTDESECLR